MCSPREGSFISFRNEYTFQCRNFRNEEFPNIICIVQNLLLSGMLALSNTALCFRLHTECVSKLVKHLWIIKRCLYFNFINSRNAVNAICYCIRWHGSITFLEKSGIWIKTALKIGTSVTSVYTYHILKLMGTFDNYILTICV